MKTPAQKFKWWWQDMEKAKRTSKALRVCLDSPLHRRETLRAAWYYEAEKRLTGRYRFDNKPFPRLKINQMRDAVYIWGYDPAERRAGTVMMIPCEAKDAPFENANMYWPRISLNLEASNEAIFRVLVEHLNEVRTQRNIKPSKRGRKAGVNPHKNEAWKQIEAHDLGKDLGDSGRKQKSEMSRKYFEQTGSRHLPEGITRI
jgi:hypothetical protein